MVTVKFNGGVGNQLFQYAFCLFCLDNGMNVMVDDTIYQRKEVHGGFLLPEFIIDFSSDFTKMPLEDSVKENRLGYLDRIENKLLQHYGNHYFEDFFRESESILPFLSVKQNRGENIYLEGYWQYLDVVEAVLPKLKKRVRHMDSLEAADTEVKKLFTRISDCNSVAVHVRRGDYVADSAAAAQYGSICTNDYYTAAIRLVDERCDDPHYFVFSDDEAYCREVFSGYRNMEIVHPAPPEQAYLDILLMAQCRHHIIANSSFSWWGTMLSNQKGIIVMPTKWDHTKPVNSLIIPGSILIDHMGEIQR